MESLPRSVKRRYQFKSGYTKFCALATLVDNAVYVSDGLFIVFDLSNRFRRTNRPIRFGSAYFLYKEGFADFVYDDLYQVLLFALTDAGFNLFKKFSFYVATTWEISYRQLLKQRRLFNDEVNSKFFEFVSECRKPRKAVCV